MVTSFFGTFFAKSAVKFKKYIFYFLCKNRPKWRHNDVIVIFWVLFCVF